MSTATSGPRLPRLPRSWFPIPFPATTWRWPLIPRTRRCASLGNVGYYCGGAQQRWGGFMWREIAAWGRGRGHGPGQDHHRWLCRNERGRLDAGRADPHQRQHPDPRCGVAQKGGDIVVEGDIGYLSGFMAHTGRIITLGNAGDATGDSLWEGSGVGGGRHQITGTWTAHAVEPSAEEASDVEELLAGMGLGDSTRDWKKSRVGDSDSGISKAGTPPHG